MTAKSLLSLLVFLSSASDAAGLARWSASDPAKASGLQLLRQDTDWRLERSAGGKLAAVIPLNDHYRRSTFTVRLEKPSPAGAWLTVAYLDQGYGLISLATGPRRPGIGPQDQWGIVRLNTGKIRRAIFRLPEESIELQIAGVPRLAELVVTGERPPYEAAPVVGPAFQLHRPLDLVISSGADANPLDGLQDSLANLRNLLPLARALGFNGIASYVKWAFVERSPGVFDWSFYDAIVADKATWPTPKCVTAPRGPNAQGGIVLSETISGPPPCGSLALTESFVERLTTLSAWLMGYTVAYLRRWETRLSRKSQAKS